MPAVSVIIPVYNKIRYLRSLLEQLQAQTFTDYECLLIDDGSTDGSGQVCDEFAAQDSRLRVFHIPNGGVSHARNVGLDAAKGMYITFLDGDDAILANHLEVLTDAMEHSGADLVVGGYDKIAHDGHRLQTVVPPKTGTFPFRTVLEDFAQVQRNTGLYGCCVSKVFPRRLIADIRFDESLKLAEDFDFYLNLYRRIETVCFIDNRTYLYLQEAENSTGNTASEEIDYLAQLRINLRYRNLLLERQVWNGENRRIVEERLSSYAYFVLFHTPVPIYRERFDALYKLYQDEQFPLSPQNIIGKWLVFCLRRNLYTVSRLTMQLYRWTRSMRR